MRTSSGWKPFLGRRRWLWLPALLVAVAVVLGAGRTAAQPEETPGFVWGLVASPDVGWPLDDGLIIDAIALAVDGDAISNRFLGEPGLVVFVLDASQPAELSEGSNRFAPEKSRYYLEQAGVSALTLTVAGDPAVPLTAQIADAIASDLRANIGAEVTVVEGDADLVVRQASPPPTPVPPLPPGTVSFELTCSPDTFQPDVWVAVECVSRLTNNGPDALSDVWVNVTSGSGGTVIPEYYWMWDIRDGQYAPVGTTDLTFEEEGGLRPGQTTESRLLVLLLMREGTYEGADTVTVGGREGASAPIRFVTDSGAPAPPANLLVTKTLVDERTPEGTPLRAATYETRVTNQGPRPITSLMITDRSEYVALMGSDPAPADQNSDVHLLFWDLASFGKDSLAPGESLVLRTTYGPVNGSDCAYVSSGVVVETAADGQVERYATRPDESVLVGDCSDEYGVSGGMGGGMGVPVSGLGRGGEGPAAEGDIVWAAAVVLAASGVALLGAARLMRRRSRR